MAYRNVAYPAEFRQRAIELYRSSGKSMEALAKELGISATTLGNWVKQARIDAGEAPGIASEDREEVVRLRRENRRLEMEVEILKRAAAFFARENVPPNEFPAGPGACRGGDPDRGGLPGAEGVGVRVSRLADATRVAAIGLRLGADRGDPSDP